MYVYAVQYRRITRFRPSPLLQTRSAYHPLVHSADAKSYSALHAPAAGFVSSDGGGISLVDRAVEGCLRQRAVGGAGEPLLLVSRGALPEERSEREYDQQDEVV